MFITCHISDDFHRPSHLPLFSFHISYVSLFLRFPFQHHHYLVSQNSQVRKSGILNHPENSRVWQPLSSNTEWKARIIRCFFSWILGENIQLPTYDWLDKGCATGTLDNSASVVLPTTTWGPFDKTNSVEPAWVAGHRVEEGPSGSSHASDSNRTTGRSFDFQLERYSGDIMSAAADRGALLRGSRGRLIAHRRGPPQATYTLISTPLTISLAEPKREEPLSPAPTTPNRSLSCMSSWMCSFLTSHL